MERHLLVIICLLVASLGHAQSDALDSLLTVQRQRAGALAEDLFAPLDDPVAAGISLSEAADYRFLLANLPLSDLAAMTAEDLLENLRLARSARETLSWGATVSEELWRHYVLPHRISQEPFTRWRKRFMEEISPRLAGMSMSDAALEVNHWCHELATYRPTDGRDQDPLTTIRAGYGRCEEEMILAIAALRSVGIPARQCYTPYWAHTNDNHAWVEAWTAGHWHYFGACEPAATLDQAWFTDPVQRAMLVVSSAFGDIPARGADTSATGGEQVLRRYGRSSSVNSTAVYGPVRSLRLRVQDQRGRPQADQRVLFHLYNYGGWMPALAQTTDADGRLELVCGRGDWLVTSGDGKRAGLLHNTAQDSEQVLVLDEAQRMTSLTSLDYQPPPKPETSRAAPGMISAEGLARGLTTPEDLARADSLFQRRLQRNDSLREARVWSGGLLPSAHGALATAPDSMDLLRLLEAGEATGLPRAETLRLLRSARGNSQTLLDFLGGAEAWSHWSAVRPGKLDAPSPSPSSSAPDRCTLRQRLRLLVACSDKDLCEIDASVLDDHLAGLEPLQASILASVADSSLTDTLNLARIKEAVLPPRIDHEPCLPWRAELARFLAARSTLSAAKGDKALLRWIRDSLIVEEDADRLGAPPTAAQTLALRRGTRGDVERFYIGACRARGIPARRDPLSGRLQRWDENSWTTVKLFKSKGRSRQAMGTLRLAAASGDSLSAAAPCFQDWQLARWETDHLEAVDLGWHEALAGMRMPLEVPVGLYCLSSGRRREDGSAAVSMQWVEVKKGRESALTLKLD